MSGISWRRRSARVTRVFRRRARRIMPSRTENDGAAFDVHIIDRRGCRAGQEESRGVLGIRSASIATDNSVDLNPGSCIVIRAAGGLRHRFDRDVEGALVDHTATSRQRLRNYPLCAGAGNLSRKLGRRDPANSAAQRATVDSRWTAVRSRRADRRARCKRSDGAGAQQQCSPPGRNAPRFRRCISQSCAPLSRIDANSHHFGDTFAGQQRFHGARKGFRLSRSNITRIIWLPLTAVNHVTVATRKVLPPGNAIHS